jgi:hypothetical protein
MLPTTLLLQVTDFDWFERISATLSNLPAVIDGTIAFVMLFLAIYVGLMSIIPLPEPPLASMGLINLSFFILLGILFQVIFKGGNLDSAFAPGVIRDFVFLGLSMIFARNSWIGLLLLVIYVYGWGLPDAMNRCGSGCPFESLEVYFRQLY